MPNSTIMSTTVVRPFGLTTITRPIDQIDHHIAVHVTAMDVSYLTPPRQFPMKLPYDPSMIPGAPTGIKRQRCLFKA